MSVRKFRIAMAQLNLAVGDLTGNTQKIIDHIDKARGLKADLVAFPELAIPGYPPEDLIFRSQFVRQNRESLDEVVAASDGICVVVGFIDSGGDDNYNAAAVSADGQLAGVYHKIFLPTYGVFDEDRYFRTGAACPVFVVNGVAVGVNVCEDIWYADGPTSVQSAAGAEVIVNINGSPYHAGKRTERENMLSDRASENGVFVTYVNLVGGQDELVFDGGSMAFDPAGDLIASADQFEEQMLVVDLELTDASAPRPIARRSDAASHVGQPRTVNVSGYTSVSGKPPVPRQLAQPLDEEAEVYGALVLGTRDYVRKCGFERVLVALSGGIDSSLVAAIAVDALGSDNVVGVAMPSRYSSDGSVSDAVALANNLGIELWTAPIEAAFQAYLDTLSPQFEGTEWGVAEENIQSRIRGNLIMALSNKFGSMVLTTGNKSEMATGYATIYGDMSGGFAVIKDVPKVLCYRLAEHRNRQGDGEVIPPSVIEKPPSAELRPDQFDEDSLPAYEILDPILKAYVEDDVGFDDIVGMGFDADTVKQVVALVDRSEYKRRQAAPGIKITPRNFGRDRRMPIANRFRPY